MNPRPHLRNFALGLAMHLALSSFAGAAVDFSMDGTVRTYPLSGLISSQLGYGLLLWGQPGSGSAVNPWYGYIRPYIEYDVAGIANGGHAATYNSGTVGLGVFPLSILGVRAGTEAISNVQDYKAYDCVSYECTGRFSRTFIEAQVTLGAGPVFVHGRAKIEDWKQDSSQTLDFIEPTSGLAARHDGDRLRTVVGIGGVKISDSWKVFYTGLYSQMEKLNGDSHFHVLNVAWQTGAWRLVVAGGSFVSTLKKQEPTALLRVQWTPLNSLAIF